MKKKNIIYLLLCFFSFATFSQTEIERKKIIASYDSNKLKTLIHAFEEQDKAREKRVSAYLRLHPISKRKFKIDNKNYIIYDIRDGKPILGTTENAESAITTRTDKLHNSGSLGLNLEGQNMIIGVWDEESALPTHVEFLDDQPIPQSRIFYPEFGNSPFLGTTSDHATHVAGTLIAKGVNPDAKGMAPKATLRSYDWFSDTTEAAIEGGNGLLISNHSYTFSALASTPADEVGAYMSRARNWDEIVYTAPSYLPVMAAGNNGSSANDYPGQLASGYDKLTGSTTAKNTLVVAGANPFLIGGGPSFLLQISNFSSQGPTDDFRVKPDIAGRGGSTQGAGVTVFSAGDDNDAHYWGAAGTSMASPNVSGTCLLLQQYYNQLNSNYMRASTLKGLICHTALDDSRLGPDPIYGWGFLDAEASANVIKDTNDGNAVISELAINNGQTYTYQFTAGSGGPLKATICWTDPPGDVSNSPSNVLSPRLVNDLDVRLEDGNATVFTPWKLDKTNVAGNAIKGDNNVDNIERIDINAPVSGNYTLTVSHKGSLTDGAQAFSLIITGSGLTLNNKTYSAPKMSIWPIPAENKINISLDTPLERPYIQIYSVEGKVVYASNVEKTKLDNFSINTSKFSKGIYFLTVSGNNYKHTKKILIK